MQDSLAKVIEVVSQPDELAMHRELIQGLLATQKWIDPKYFYNEYGSTLFEQITQLPEYYPTRVETQLIKNNSAEIADVIGRGQVLIEPGAGSCTKARLLLDKLQPACFVAIDLSGEFLLAATTGLQTEFPDINILPVVDDMASLAAIPDEFSALSRTVFYPGSTIGNYRPAEALGFLQHISEVIGATGGLLIGVDLHKDSGTLNAAYNDRQGVTAAFNLNILNHVNSLLGSDFDVSQFKHVAFYNETERRIEMYLECSATHSVNIGDESVLMTAGERILTEYSHKYSLPDFADLAAQAGLTSVQNWVDKDEMFSLQYYRLG
jgi:dimethylhistidine N-methyltransferase